AMDVAERHRQSIDRWFYPCAHAFHRGLADLYEADSRFAANIDKYAEGLTEWWSSAIRANAIRALEHDGQRGPPGRRGRGARTSGNRGVVGAGGARPCRAPLVVTARSLSLS